MHKPDVGTNANTSRSMFTLQWPQREKEEIDSLGNRRISPDAILHDGLNVLDAPLPASFDSLSVSATAENTSFSPSVPPLFTTRPSFGTMQMECSTPPAKDEPVARGYSHMERFYRLATRTSSTSDDEVDSDFDSEDNYVPQSLPELLTPRKKTQRSSATSHESHRRALSERADPVILHKAPIITSQATPAAHTP